MSNIQHPLNILQISTHDIAGGAEKIAWNLFQEYRKQGHDSWLAAGYIHSNNIPNVVQIPNGGENKRLKLLTTCLNHFIKKIREKAYCVLGGFENFDFPETWYILELVSRMPDIVHCHNLHGGYFDLRILPWLSKQVPVVLTLHDAWLISGHCAHSFDCERWKTGCGNCPDLSIPPELHKDRTAYNWRRKQKIYSRSQVYVVTPSKWLMRNVEQSMLAPAIVKKRVIPNGINLSVFHTADRRTIRMLLGIPQDAKVIIFAANGIRNNVWKDYKTIREAIELIANKLRDEHVLFLGLGEEAPSEQVGSLKIQFIPYQKEVATIAHYYQASDIYLHAAHVETFPTVILEALACGIPVLATAVGGIPEQVRGLQIEDCEWGNYNAENATGILVPPRNAEIMAKYLEILLYNDNLRTLLGKNGVNDVHQRFGENRQIKDYLNLYEEILVERKFNKN